jgi:hypothetical protein
MKVSGVYCCPCGVETECGWHDLDVGKVMQCPECKAVYGHVRPRWGGSVWVRISKKDVKFHELLREPAEEGEE